MNLESWLNEPYVPIALGVVAVLFVITIVSEWHARKAKNTSSLLIEGGATERIPETSKESGRTEGLDEVSRIIAYAQQNRRPLGRSKTITFSVERMKWIQPNEASH